MAERVVYRGAGGRFVSRAVAEELGLPPIIFGGIPSGTGPDYAPEEALDDWENPDYIDPDNLWQVEEKERGWVAIPGLNESDIFGLEPPEGARAFRVFVNVLDNPDYPRSMASTGWIDVALWPPSSDMIRGVTPEGYNQIRFAR
jgi:hypothetical protein